MFKRQHIIICEMLPHNFLEAFTDCLISSNHAAIKSHFPAVLNPHNLAQIVPHLQHVQMVFIMCQALKDKIKRKNSQNFLLDEQPTPKEELLSKLKAVVDIAAHNPILTNIQNYSSSPSKAEYPLKNESYAGLSSDQVRSRTMWYECLNYLELLLTSVGTMVVTAQDSQWAQATSRLREQLLGKLIIEALLMASPGQYKALTFQYLIRHVEAYLPQNKESHMLIANVIYEATYYANHQLSRFDSYRILKKSGGYNIMRILLNYYEQILTIGVSSQTIPKFIDGIYEMMNVTDEDDYNYENNDEMNELMLDEIAPEWRIPAWLEKFNLKMVDLFRGSMRALFNRQDYRQVKSKIVRILRAIIRGDSGSNFKQDLAESNTGNLYQTVFNFLNELIEESTNSLSSQMVDDDEDIQYYQFELTSTLHTALTSNRSFTLKEKRLFEKCLISYYPKLLQILRLDINEGIKHPFPMMFLTMEKFFKEVRIQYKLTKTILSLFDRLIAKCKQQSSHEEFLNFQDENSACADFFRPITKIFSKMWDDPTARSLQVLSSQVSNYVCSKDAKGQYFVKFMIELVKHINVPSLDFQFHQQLFDTAHQLMFSLKWEVHKRQYIRLLDVVLDLLIEEGNIDLDSILIHKVTRITNLPAFVRKTVAVLVQLLSGEQEEYLIEEIVVALCRTYSRFKSVSFEALELEHPNIVSAVYLKTPEQRKDDMMKYYFGNVFSIIDQNNFTLLDKMHTIETRRKELELIVILSVYSMKDVYVFFDKFMDKKEFRSQNDVLYFLIDATGALQADIAINFKTLLFELIVLKLKQHSYILQIFTEEKMTNESYYSTFTGFMNRYLLSWKLVRYQIQIYDLQPAIHVIVDRLSLLNKIYAVQNQEVVADIYTNFIKVPNLFASIPEIPQKIYNSPSSLIFCRQLLDSLHRFVSEKDIIILFKNIFARKTFLWTFQEKNEGYHEQLIRSSEKPSILFKFLDVIQTTKIAVFFDYAKLIESIIIDLFTLYVEKYSQTSASGFDSSDDDEESINYVEEFTKNKTQLKYMEDLCLALFNFEAITGQQTEKYSQFNKKFISAAKQLVGRLNVGKK